MKPLDDIKIFKSLNCICCKEPFVSKARSLRLLACGLAMCHECLEKEKSLIGEERKHQCKYGEKCFDVLADALADALGWIPVDVLSDLPGVTDVFMEGLSENYLTLSPILGGYLLRKPCKLLAFSLDLSECPICHEKYSNKVASKKAFVFRCKHIVCIECYQKKIRPNNDVATQADWKYKVACSTCNAETLTNGANLWKDWLQDFWNELAEMTLQLEEMNESGYRFCDECKKLDIVDEMYHCNVNEHHGCSLQLCAKCIYEDHRSHEAITLLQKEVGQLSQELCDLSINEVRKYNRESSKLHKKLSDDLQRFDQKLLKKERGLTNVLTFEDLRKKHKCKGLKTEFETCSEEYMSHLRRYDKRVKELMETLDGDPN